MKGYLFALCSVFFVTIAQLMLRWSVLQLPDLHHIILAAVRSGPLLVLAAGLGCYALSMLCWLLALRHIPLGHAYPLLSLSYVLVWALAVILPFSHETFHWGALGGVSLIVLGLFCVTWPKHH